MTTQVREPQLRIENGRKGEAENAPKYLEGSLNYAFEILKYFESVPIIHLFAHLITISVFLFSHERLDQLFSADWLVLD